MWVNMTTIQVLQSLIPHFPKQNDVLMGGSIWSSERFWCPEWFSSISYLWSVWIKVQFSLSFLTLLTFCWGEGLLKREGGVLKLQGLFHNKPAVVSINSWSGIRTPSLVVCHNIYWHFRCRCNPNGMQCFYRSPAKLKKHTPASLSSWPGLLPLPYFSTSSILKCPLALGSLPVPCRQLRPSTKQCNVYS